MKQHLLKNTYAAIVALFIAMMALPTTAQAQTKYDLNICGTQVTSDNCGDLSVIDGVEGTVKYDPDSKTLTLEGAKLNTESNCIKSEIDGLTIKVGGTNDLNAGYAAAIKVNAPTTITGGGTLNVKSKDTAIYARETNLTIKNCIVNAKGYYGIAGYDGSKEKLLISKATVTAEGRDGRDGSICFLKEITLEDCAITQPAGATFDESKHAIVLNGEIVKSEVKIVQTKYDLWINDTRVTSDNCGDLSGIDGVEGTVKYDPDSKTLTLEGAKLNVRSSCIGSKIDGLTIKVSGTNELNTEYAAAVVYAPTTITGGGTLNAKSPSDCVIYVGGTNLTIKDCIVNVKGNYGIAGDEGSTEKLLISNATVTAEGEKGSICNFKEITLEGCAITQPAGAVVDNSQGAVVLNGEKVTSEVKIVQTKYALKICGTQVTSGNCGDLSVIDGVEGTVKYDPDNKTLTLEGAKLNVEGNDNCINSEIDGLTIKVSGTNELNAGETAIIVYAPTTLTGGGTLNAKSEKYTAIYAYETDLTIKDCIVNAKGNYGIAGNNGSNEKLLISNATVRAEGEAGSICDFKEITLEDCAITQPAGAVVDNSQGAVVLNGEIVKSEVKIVQTKYRLWICDTQVTSDNCGDLSVIDGVEGTAKYDPDSKTLTLEGAKLNVEGFHSGIESKINGLTIKVSGTNELNAGETAIFADTPMTITGGGTLNVKSEEGCGIYAWSTNLTIKDCIVNVKGKWGIIGQNGSKEKLFISKATVTAEGGEGSICDFASLTLEYSNITQPSGARFDEAKHAVVLNGEVVTSKIVITRDPAGINTPTIDTATKQGIYTLSGVKLNGEVEDLPKGIYIINGKKVVKK